MAEWLGPLPVRLFMTVATDPPLGPGTHRMLLEHSCRMVEHLTGQEVGAIGFTQPNTRGGIHQHAVHFGEQGAANFNHAETAQLLELHASQYQPQALDYDQGLTSVRWEIDRPRSGGLLKYCVRYSSRHTSGDMFEAGIPLDELLRRYRP